MYVGVIGVEVDVVEEVYVCGEVGEIDGCFRFFFLLLMMGECGESCDDE